MRLQKKIYFSLIYIIFIVNFKQNKLGKFEVIKIFTVPIPQEMAASCECCLFLVIYETYVKLGMNHCDYNA